MDLEFALFGLMMIAGGLVAVTPAFDPMLADSKYWRPLVDVLRPWAGGAALLYGAYFLLRYTLWYLMVVPLLMNVVLVLVGTALSRPWLAVVLQRARRTVASRVDTALQRIARIQVPLGAACATLGVYCVWVLCGTDS